MQGSTAARVYGGLVGIAALALALTLPLAGAHATADSGPTKAQSTSFGVLRVEHAVRVPMARVRFGTPHDPIGPHKVQVEIDALVENRIDRAVVFSPGQFRLRLNERGVTIAAVEGTASATTTLQPSERISVRLTFIAPRKAERMSLEFHDIGLAQPLRVELGRIPIAGRPGDLLLTPHHATGG